MEQKIKTLQIIHLAIIIGLAIFMTMVFQPTMQQLTGNTITSQNIYYLFVPVSGVVLSLFIYKNILKQIKPTWDENKKFEIYQTACIARWCILEGVCFLILIMFSDLSMTSVLILLYMVFQRPTLAKFEMEIDNNKM